MLLVRGVGTGQPLVWGCPEPKFMFTVYLMALASLAFVTWLALDWYQELQRAQLLKARAARLHEPRIRVRNLPR